MGPTMSHMSARISAAGRRSAERIRSFDWPSTPLGPIGGWPSIGPSGVDGQSKERMRSADRRPAAEILADMWDIVGPMMRGVVATGEATWSVDQALRLNRRGYVEEAFFTYSYSP